MSKISQYYINMALLGVAIIASGHFLIASSNVKIGLTFLSTVLILWIGVVSHILLRKNYIGILLLNTMFIMLTLCFYSAWGTALTFAQILVCCCVFNNLVISRRMYCWVHCVCFVGILAYISTLNISMIDHAVAFNRHGDILNPNTMGLLVLGGVLHGVCWISVWHNKLVRSIFLFLLMVGGGWLIMRFRCRSAFLIFGLFWLFFIGKHNPFSEDTCCRITRLILLGGLLFPCIYVFLYLHTDLNWELFGKGLFTGRQFVWHDTIHYILQNPLLGVGNSGLMEMGSSFEAARLTDAAHNVMLGIWKSLGFIPLVSFWWLLCHKGHYKERPVVILAAQIAFLVSLFGSYFEIFYVNMGYGALFLLLLLMKIKPEKPAQNPEIIFINTPNDPH